MGLLVVLADGSRLRSLYAHLSVARVAVGDRVSAGSEIGRVGATGDATGPHLHFELRVGGAAGRSGRRARPLGLRPGLARSSGESASATGRRSSDGGPRARHPRHAQPLGRAPRRRRAGSAGRPGLQLAAARCGPDARPPRGRQHLGEADAPRRLRRRGRRPVRQGERLRSGDDRRPRLRAVAAAPPRSSRHARVVERRRDGARDQGREPRPVGPARHRWKRSSTRSSPRGSSTTRIPTQCSA